MHSQLVDWVMVIPVYRHVNRNGGTELIDLAHVVDEESCDSLTDYAYRTLRTNIVTGALRPQTRLRELEVADALGVSRVPVRDSFSRLEKEGLIERRRHGRGAVVATPTQAVVIELYQARAGLERVSARLAAENATDEEVRMLAAIIDEGTSAAAEGDWDRSSALGSRFHRGIAAASRNAHLLELIGSYDVRIGWAHSAVARHGGAVRWFEHIEVFDAIRAGDAAAAANAMESHTDASIVCFTEASMAGLLG